MGKDKRFLPNREIDILVRLSLGYSDNDIADELLLSAGTVKGHVHRLLNRIGVKNRTQLAIYAYQSGLVSPFDIDLGRM